MSSLFFFNNKTLSPIYVTKSIETILGYKQQQFIDWGENALLNVGAFDCSELWRNLTKWQGEFLNIDLEPGETPFTFRAFIGGYCYNHKDGRTKKFLFRTEHPIRENNAFPDYHFTRLEELDHLFKEEGFWIYYEKSNGIRTVTKFYSNDVICDAPITKREKEILKLIATGMGVKEIAGRLFISIETVHKHRKNMIKKLNAKNMASVVQICKLCYLI